MTNWISQLKYDGGSDKTDIMNLIKNNLKYLLFVKIQAQYNIHNNQKTRSE